MRPEAKMLKRIFSQPTCAFIFVICFAMVSVAGVAARANDPWKDKAPEDWDEKDVQKILTDSPWSRPFQIGSAANGSAPSTITSVGSAAHTETATVDPLRSGNPAGPGSNSLPPGVGPEMKFTVSWRSSHTVREALLREKELSGSLPDQARKDLAAKYDEYQISISGANLRLFGKEGAESLKAHSYLMPKSSKVKISPTKVIVQTRQDGTAVAILFDFPQKTAGGEPTIALAEKSVEFSAKAGDLPLKVTFDISKMSTKEGRDF
jgi:hypothetical protein